MEFAEIYGGPPLLPRHHDDIIILSDLLLCFLIKLWFIFSLLAPEKPPQTHTLSKPSLMNYRQLPVLRHSELHPIEALLSLQSVVVKSSSSMQPSSERLFSPEASPSNATNEFTIASFIAAVIFFSLLAIYLRYFTSSRQARRPSLRKGVDRSTVLSLPVSDYNAVAMYQRDCAICLTEFNENETVKLIPFCKHVFHTECLDTWLFSHASCPVCRSTRLFDADNGVADGGSGSAKEDIRPDLRGCGERSNTQNNDTSINIESFGNGTRRISSCTSFTGRAPLLLPRACSF